MEAGRGLRKLLLQAGGTDKKDRREEAIGFILWYTVVGSLE